MLIRLTAHHLENPQHIDKLICIKGLPEDWFFRDNGRGMELAPPWKPDVTENIPTQIRHLCDVRQVVFYYPPIEKGRDGIIESKPVYAMKLDFGTEPGRQMWAKVERYLEKTIPRDVEVARPVLCAKDLKSPFETYLATRRRTGGMELEPMDVPVIDLTLYNAPKPISPLVAALPPAPPTKIVAATVPATAPTAPPADTLLKCEECDYTHTKKQAIRMHTMKRHPKLEKVGAKS